MLYSDSVMALDISKTRTGVALGPPGATPHLFSIGFGREDDDPEDVFGRALVWLAEQTREFPPLLIAIEAPIPHHKKRGFTNAKTLTLLNGLFATMAAVARARGIPVKRAPISTVRKHFIGVGNLPGDAAKRETKKRCAQLGWDCPDTDAADAAAIWDWATNTMRAR